ncbi:MAG TPA: peptidoglycan recognition family protein [Phycisphaerae bacterium]|nr:peptidoglycan recognition family protein [Phycisphaerae bacterium]
MTNWRTWTSLVVGGAALGLVGCDAQPTGELAALPVHELDFSSGPAPAGGSPRPRPARTGHPWSAGGLRPWRHIVIHHSATDRGSAAVFDKAHRQRGWDELGYHFVIDNGQGGPDGRVEVGSRWTAQKWGAHTGGTPDNEYNNYGIGICVVGNFEKASPSPGQLASLRELVTFLAGEYGIGPENVLGHRDAPNAKTACPGRRLHEFIHRTLRPELARAQGPGS